MRDSQLRFTPLKREEGDKPPLCNHGPTILFEKKRNDDTLLDKYYACSACRDRKQCNFYMKYGTEESSEKMAARREQYDMNLNIHTYSPPSDDAWFCCKCNTINKKKCSTHKKFNKKLTLEEQKYPSRWINAKETNRTNAQFFFDDKVVDVIMTALKDRNCTHVICLGSPKLHEVLVDDLTVQSFLLDIDSRLGRFHEQFATYNMFNNHFFDSAGMNRLIQFCSSAENIMIVVDPPYGGLLEPLSWSLQAITQRLPCDNEIAPTLLFFPYFNEHQVSKYLPGFTMSDYKVNYSNHSGYRDEGKVRGSPARMYTNGCLKDLKLPSDEGYKYCESCQKYVSKENKHCNECKACTTKDGNTYIHCKICERCVKPTWDHCGNCNTCHLKVHGCKSVTSEKTSGSSMITGQKRTRNPRYFKTKTKTKKR